MREAGETAQVTSVLSSVVNHETDVKDFDEGSDNIRCYFRKMSGEERRNDGKKNMRQGHT